MAAYPNPLTPAIVALFKYGDCCAVQIPAELSHFVAHLGRAMRPTGRFGSILLKNSHFSVDHNSEGRTPT
jgi:hypothetical protein